MVSWIIAAPDDSRLTTVFDQEMHYCFAAFGLLRTFVLKGVFLKQIFMCFTTQTLNTGLDRDLNVVFVMVMNLYSGTFSDCL